jgi:hypothetical protein
MISRKQLHKEQAVSLLIAMVYVEVFTLLTQENEWSIVEEKLKTMGANIAKSYFEIYKPSKSSISGIIKDLAINLAGMKRIKLMRTEDGFTITTHDCPLCQSNIEVEGKQFCIPTMAILETFLNLMFNNTPWKFPYKQVIGTVKKSISSGDDECEYHYRLIRR